MNEISDSSFVEASTIRWSNKFSNQWVLLCVQFVFTTLKCLWNEFFYYLELNFSVELLQISLKSVGLTVLRSTEIFLLSHHLSNIFIPHSVAFLVFFAWAFCSISSSCSLFKSDFWLEKCWSSILQLYKNYKMSNHKLVPALALKWYPQGSWSSHRTSKVVWHLCSQSESSCQMHLQPSHFSFGPQQGAFYRKQFVIWARLLI